MRNHYFLPLCRRLGFLLSLVCGLAGLAAAQTSITGKVISGENNNPLPGVNVTVKGTTTGTTTGADGTYSLGAPAGSTLVFSFIGFVTEEVAAGNRTVVDVTLNPDIKSLSEVVVIGYGERERKDLTGAITSVNAQEITSTPIASVDQALQGRVSGVQITTTSGDPGARQTIRIRGVGTLGNNDPLIVIDGIPVAENQIGNLQDTPNPLALINPADIESVDVLKDASAAAIYGVRASNGVIIITTKKGKLGKARVGFDMYRGVQQIRKFYDVLGTAGYAALVRETYVNGGRGGYRRNCPDPTGQACEEYVLDDVYDPAFAGNLLGVDQDWQRAIYNKNALIENYNLSVSGANENADYSVSGGFFQQEGLKKYDGLRRFTFNTNTNMKVGNWLRIGQTLKAAITNDNTSGGQFVIGSFGEASQAAPLQSIFNPDLPGGWEIVNNDGRFGPRITAPRINTKQNWLARAASRDSEVNSARVLGNVYGEVEPLKGLKVRGNLGLDYLTSRSTDFALSDLQYGGGQVQRNNYGERNLERYNLITELTGTYARSFGEHNFSLLAGVLNQKFRLYGITASATDLPSNDPALRQVQFDQNPDTQPLAENFADQWALQGYIGRLSWNFRNKYYLDATVRRDGSSRFAPENRWGTFPSVAAAWRLSQEPFMQNLPWVSDLKLRAGWGQLGNQETASFAFISFVSVKGDYILGEKQASTGTAFISNFANRDIGWETSTQTNIGFDAGLFNNKLGVTFDYFIKQTDDILTTVRLPLVTGLGDAPLNAASVRNAGVEVEVSYQNQAGDFRYNLSGNFTAVRNRVTDLGFSDPITIGNFRTEVGQPIGYLYGYQTNGIFQTQSDLDAYRAGTEDSQSSPDAAPGDIRFVDNNGPAPDDAPRGTYFSGQPDGVVDANDRTYLGKVIPDFYYGFTLGGGWKGFDVSLFFQGVQGVDLYNAVRATGESMNGGANGWTSTGRRWTGPGTSNAMPRAVVGDPNNNNRFSDRWVENGSFLRFKNLQVGYAIPVSILQKARMSNLRVYLSAQNLAVFSKYTGLDPEVQGNSDGSSLQVSALDSGTDNGGTPLPRILTIGLSAGF
ncbi:MAG TPA: TonB-dependent receptor [Cytophagales bacterium]